jgi:hypothetical protein
MSVAMGHAERLLDTVPEAMEMTALSRTKRQ